MGSRCSHLWNICAASTCSIAQIWLIVAACFAHMWLRLRAGILGRTDGWVTCFPAYWCWYPVMFALAAFRGALLLKLASSFPSLRSHAPMRALPSPRIAPPLRLPLPASCCACSSPLVPPRLSTYQPPPLALIHLLLSSFLPHLRLHPVSLLASPFLFFFLIFFFFFFCFRPVCTGLKIRVWEQKPKKEKKKNWKGRYSRWWLAKH